MKKILLTIIALFIITISYTQRTKEGGETTINAYDPVKVTEDPGMGGEIAAHGTIDISPRLRNSKGASVFGGKFKYTTVMVHMQPGSHRVFARGMNGKLTYLFSLDSKGNEIPATYSTGEVCMACIPLKNGRKPCYVIDCNNLPVAEKSKIKSSTKKSNT